MPTARAEMYAHRGSKPASSSIATYMLAGLELPADAAGFAHAVAHAYRALERPRCLCQAGGVEMYIARQGSGFVIKRMPDTGSRHAPDCLSYEPPAQASGLQLLVGSVIREDTSTGTTTLRLDFALSRMPRRSVLAPHARSGKARAGGLGLSLRALLHYLWQQADLTRWRPGFAGRRTWATVRRHLLWATESKIARGAPLRGRLFVPEPFTVDRRNALSARRMAQWSRAISEPGKAQQLMLLVGELKEIAATPHGHVAVIKHVPEQRFVVDAQLYRRLCHRFAMELDLWSEAPGVRMVAIGTFSITRAGVPVIEELSLMPTTSEWLPVEDAVDLQLVRHLVDQRRSFVKALRYELDAGQALASVTLTDCGTRPAPLAIERSGRRFGPGSEEPLWTWRPTSGAFPQLPSVGGTQ